MRLALSMILLAATSTAAMAEGKGADGAYGDGAGVGGTYVSTYGGANWAEDFGYESKWLKIDSGTQTGYVIGGTIGTGLSDVVPGLRAELDLSYRRNPLDASIVICHSPYGFDGSDETVGLTANAVYDLPVNWPVRPYVLVGAGYGDRTITVQPFGSDLEAGESGFVWQVGAGANVQLTDRVKAGVGYRYFEAPEIERSFGPVHIEADGGNHSVIAQLTLDLN